MVHVVVYTTLTGLTYVKPPEDEGMPVEKSAAKVLCSERKLSRHDADEIYRQYANPLIESYDSLNNFMCDMQFRLRKSGSRSFRNANVPLTELVLPGKS